MSRKVKYYKHGARPNNWLIHNFIHLFFCIFSFLSPHYDQPVTHRTNMSALSAFFELPIGCSHNFAECDVISRSHFNSTEEISSTLNKMIIWSWLDPETYNILLSLNVFSTGQNQARIFWKYYLPLCKPSWDRNITIVHCGWQRRRWTLQ